MSRHRGEVRPRRRGCRASRVRWGRLVLAAAAAVAAVVLGSFAYDALTVRGQLDRATAAAQSLQDEAARTGEVDEQQLSILQDAAGRAADHTTGPLWSLASTLPWVGDDVDAVRVSTRSADLLARRAVPRLVRETAGLDLESFAPRDGRIDVAQVARLAPQLAAASRDLRADSRDLDAIDTTALVGPVRRPVEELQQKVASVRATVDAAAAATRVAPSMLGADRPRTYLLLVQNNAEARTTGGIPGALALLRASDGRLTIDPDFSRASIPSAVSSAFHLDAAEKNLFGDTPETDIRDVNLTPEFPRSASAARAMVKAATGASVDGVLSVDPVALSYAMAGSPPVKVAGVELTSANAVAALLNEVYLRLPDPQEQDEFFARAAQGLFARLIGSARTPSIAEGLGRAARDHRILLWSAHPDEQRVLRDQGVGGSLRPEAARRVGVYLNDATSSKMQFYLRSSSTLKAVGCANGPSRTVLLSSRLRSIAPADAAALPPYLTGTGRFSARGTQRLGVQVALPEGARVTAFAVGGKPTIYRAGTVYGRPFALTSVVLEPGAEADVSVTFRLPTVPRGPLHLDTTPSVSRTRSGTVTSSVCGG